MKARSLRERLILLRRTTEARLAGRGLPLFGPALVHPGHFARAGALADGLNINGPSLIRVPDWAPRRAHPEARYYLYFAHHLGRYLRMAWAARLEGPWTLFGVGAAVGARGVFDVDGLSEVARAVGEGVRVGSEKPWGLHVASPDVHVDGEGRRFVAFVHMPVLGASRSQLTFGLESEDGLRFRPAAGGLVGLGPSYFRVFAHEGRRYALTSGGWLHRAPAGGWGVQAPWQAGPRMLEVPKDAPRFPDGSFREGVVARHLAVEVREGGVRLYFSRIGDAPEAILAADMPLQGDWRTWRAGPAREVHRARAAWEGADHPVRPSAGGIAAGGVNEVRDPYLFVDEDGRRVLVYCVQGERAIAARTLG